MPNYIYPVYLTAKEFREFPLKIQPTVIAPTKSEESLRSRKRVGEASFHGLTFLASVASIGFYTKNVDESVNTLAKSVEGVRTAFNDSKANTFLTKQNFVLNIPANVVDMQHVKESAIGTSQSELIDTKSWINLLPPSLELEQLKTDFDTDSPDYKIVCWVVSPLSPEIVYREKKIPIGLLTRHLPDAEALAKSNYEWSPAQINYYAIKTVSDLISTVPTELMYLIDPKTLNLYGVLEDKKISDQYEKLQNSWQAFLRIDQLYKQNELNTAQEFVNSALKLAPLFEKRFKNKYQDQLQKAYETYMEDAANLKNIIINKFESPPLINKDNDNLDIAKKVLNADIYETSLQKIVSRIDSKLLMTLDPSIFYNQNIFAIDEKNRDSLNDAYGKIFQNQDNNALENYRKNLLTFIDHLKNDAMLYHTASKQIEKHIETNIHRALPFININIALLKNITPADFFHYIFAANNIKINKSESNELHNAYKNVNKDPDTYREKLLSQFLLAVERAKNNDVVLKLLQSSIPMLIFGAIEHAPSFEIRAMSPDYLFSEALSLEQSSEVKTLIQNAIEQLNTSYNNVEKRQDIYINQLLEKTRLIIDALAAKNNWAAIDSIYQAAAAVYATESLRVTYENVEKLTSDAKMEKFANELIHLFENYTTHDMIKIDLANQVIRLVQEYNPKEEISLQNKSDRKSLYASRTGVLFHNPEKEEIELEEKKPTQKL